LNIRVDESPEYAMTKLAASEIGPLDPYTETGPFEMMTAASSPTRVSSAAPRSWVE
jgi:hypothetical protein